MRVKRTGILVAACLAAAGWGPASTPSEPAGRSELGRADLSVSGEMEVIASITELKAGESLPRHFHHGIESGYVLQGTLVQFPGKPPTLLATGTSVLTLRDVPHGGFTVVGPQSLKLYSVHVVDKGKPLYEWADAAGG